MGTADIDQIDWSTASGRTVDMDRHGVARVMEYFQERDSYIDLAEDVSS